MPVQTNCRMRQVTRLQPSCGPLLTHRTQRHMNWYSRRLGKSQGGALFRRNDNRSRRRFSRDNFMLLCRRRIKILSVNQCRTITQPFCLTTNPQVPSQKTHRDKENTAFINRICYRGQSNSIKSLCLFILLHR